MRILRVGDPHIRPSNIDEANRLMGFVNMCIQGSKTGIPIERLEILGDLFHTHAVIRLEVLEFWNMWLQVFRDAVETVVLVGNHDMTGDKNSRMHALTVFKRLQNERLRIIDAPTNIGIFGYLPYIHGSETFYKSAQWLADQESKVLVCHQTFSGSQYENGFYAPEGIDPDLVPFDTIISGHIHREQIIANGKVDYPGTPKWDSVSDANEKKGIWLYQHDDVTGKVIERHRISTASFCSPIALVIWNEGEEQPLFVEGSRTTIELVGSSDWIAKQKANLKGKVSIRSKNTDQKRSASRKAGNSLENYLLNLYSTNMKREDLLNYAREIGIV